MLAVAVMLTMAACATEEELACRRAQEAAEEQARQLGGAAAVAGYLILIAFLVLRRRPGPSSVIRSIATLVLGACATGAAGLLGVLIGEVVAVERNRCSEPFILFSETTDRLIAVVVVGALVVTILSVVFSFTYFAARVWRRR